jgi:hypothetical protein
MGAMDGAAGVGFRERETKRAEQWTRTEWARWRERKGSGPRAGGVCSMARAGGAAVESWANVHAPPNSDATAVQQCNRGATVQQRYNSGATRNSGVTVVQQRCNRDATAVQRATVTQQGPPSTAPSPHPSHVRVAAPLRVPNDRQSESGSRRALRPRPHPPQHAPCCGQCAVARARGHFQTRLRVWRGFCSGNTFMDGHQGRAGGSTAPSTVRMTRIRRGSRPAGLPGADSPARLLAGRTPSRGGICTHGDAPLVRPWHDLVRPLHDGGSSGGGRLGLRAGTPHLPGTRRWPGRRRAEPPSTVANRARPSNRQCPDSELESARESCSGSGWAGGAVWGHGVGFPRAPGRLQPGMGSPLASRLVTSRKGPAVQGGPFFKRHGPPRNSRL